MGPIIPLIKCCCPGDLVLPLIYRYQWIDGCGVGGDCMNSWLCHEQVGTEFFLYCIRVCRAFTHHHSFLPCTCYSFIYTTMASDIDTLVDMGFSRVKVYVPFALLLSIGTLTFSFGFIAKRHGRQLMVLVYNLLWIGKEEASVFLFLIAY